MPVEVTIRAIRRLRCNRPGRGRPAEARPDRAQIGGDEEGAVFGEEADAVARFCNAARCCRQAVPRGGGLAEVLRAVTTWRPQ